MENKTTKFYSHGACKEVTGSKHFLEVNGKTLQVDAGMFQGRREESYLKNKELNFDPAKVDALVLTHGHFDHAGALPIMVKNGFNGNIYSTPATRDIANIIMLDSAHIQAKDYEYLTAKAAKRPERNYKLFTPLYNPEDVVNTLNCFVSINYHRKFFPLPGVEAEFFDAGHILGSAMVRLKTDNGLTIGFSGDLGRKGLPIIQDPESLNGLDYLILESTYGNRLHATYGMAHKELMDIVHKAVNRKGKIIIPAFTIERTQELIYILHILTQEGKIPKIPIYIDSPMAVNATSIFKIHQECFDKATYDTFLALHIDPFGFDNIHYISTKKESIELNNLQTPAIIISASGMAETGRILHHLANNIENPANIIAVVGFMAENTLGRKIVERAKSVRIFGKEYMLKAEVSTLNAFSAHADYEEIKTWLSGCDLTKLKKIFLVHGEETAITNMKSELLKYGIKEVEIVEYGKSYLLD